MTLFSPSQGRLQARSANSDKSVGQDSPGMTGSPLISPFNRIDEESFPSLNPYIQSSWPTEMLRFIKLRLVT